MEYAKRREADATLMWLDELNYSGVNEGVFRESFKNARGEADRNLKWRVIAGNPHPRFLLYSWTAASRQRVEYIRAKKSLSR